MLVRYYSTGAARALLATSSARSLLGAAAHERQLAALHTSSATNQTSARAAAEAQLRVAALSLGRRHRRHLRLLRSAILFAPRALDS